MKGWGFSVLKNGGRCECFKDEMLEGLQYHGSYLMWELTDNLGRLPSREEIGWQLVEKAKQSRTSPAFKSQCLGRAWCLHVSIKQSEWRMSMIVVVQSLSHVWLFEIPWTAVHQASCPSPSPGACSNSCPLSRWCHPTISFSDAPFSCPIFPSIRVFSNELALCIRFPKYRSFSFHISLFNEYSGLFSFRIDWSDLLTVHVTLESSLAPQFKSIRSSVLSFLCGLSHLYMTSGKTTVLTRLTFVSKVIFLLFNTLSRFVMAFLLKERVSFHFIAAVTIHSDFGT